MAQIKHRSKNVLELGLSEPKARRLGVSAARGLCENALGETSPQSRAERLIWV
jgi:hypothetical protein